MSRIIFPPELVRDATKVNGELGWTRKQIPLVVEMLVGNSCGILGGELWWVRDGDEGCYGALPQGNGPPGIYVCETKRRSGENWREFVERCAAETLAAADRWPSLDDLPSDMSGRILYNLIWVSEAEYENLRSR